MKMYEEEPILLAMFQVAEHIGNVTRKYSQQQFTSDIKLQATTVVQLLTLARSANALADATYQYLPPLAGQPLKYLRDALVDDDDNVKPDLVWHVVRAELPPLISALRDRLG